MSDLGAGDEDDRGPPSAAEYVLGVLSAHERRAVEQRITREPAFAREVAFWEERLGDLPRALLRFVSLPAFGHASRLRSIVARV